MNAEAVIQGFIAGLTILCIIGATLLCKMMKKGTEKVKEIKQARDEELSKVDFIVTLSHILCKHPFQLKGDRLSEHRIQ